MRSLPQLRIVLLILLLYGCRSQVLVTPVALTPSSTTDRLPLVQAATTAPPIIPSTPSEPASPTAPKPTAIQFPQPSPAGVPVLPAEVLQPENAGRLALIHELRFNAWELVTALVWSPDGNWLAVAAGERIILYRSDNWLPATSFRLAALTPGLAFSPDGAWLAACSRDGYLRVWQTQSFLTTSQAQPSFSILAHRKGANVVAFSPLFGLAPDAAGRLVASGGNDAVARFWDVTTGESTGLMVGGTFAVPSIAFMPDGALLAVANGDRIRLREVGSERITGTFASDVPLYTLAISSDGRWIAAGGIDNLIRLYDPQSAYRTGQEIYPDPVVLRGHAGRADSYRALIWQVVFNPRGDLLASAGGDGALHLWDVAAAQAILAVPAHSLGAAGVAFHPGGTLLATGGLDGSVKIWGIAAP